MLNPDMHSCEFAIAIGDAWQGQGLGVQLMQALIDVARERGLKRMEGMVLAENRKMQKMMRKLGFSVRVDPEDTSMLLVSLDL
jgi:acetyltransferase